MKHLLLSLAALAMLATPASAQSPLVSAKSKAVPTLKGMDFVKKNVLGHMPQDAELTQTLKASMHRAPSREEAKKYTRDPKQMSYVVNGSELYDSAVVIPTGLDYEAINKLGYKMGVATRITSTILQRYVGNTIKTINFAPFMGNYSDAKVFIGKLASSGDGTLDMLWSKDLASVTPQKVNEVACDYKVTDANSDLFIGYVAKVTASSDDPYASTFGMCYIGYPDNTGQGYGAYSVLSGVKQGDSEESTGLIGGVAKYSKDVWGWQVPAAAFIWADTDGEGGLKQEDAYLEYFAPARGFAGRTVPVQGQITNMGVDSIKNIEYTLEYDGKTTTHTAEFSPAVKFFTSANFSIPVTYANDTKREAALLTVTKVNGVADEFAGSDENYMNNYILSFKEAYSRTPVVEELSSTTCGYCPAGIVGMDNLADSLGNKGVYISVHTDYQTALGTDPLVAESYDDFMSEYGSLDLPNALINREMIADPYYETKHACAYITTLPGEAQVSIDKSSVTLAGAVKMEATLRFNIDANPQNYGVMYVVTEDNVKNVDQLNYFVAMNLQDPTSLSDYPEDIQALGNLDYTTKVVDSQKYTFSPMTMNHVARYTDDALCYNEANYLGAIKVGQDIKLTTTLDTKKNMFDNKDNLKVAVLLMDLTSGCVVTGCQAAIKQTNQTGEVINAINNASASDGSAQVTVANGAFNVKAAHATAQVFDAEGRLVSSATINGEASLPTFGHGVYVIRVAEEGHITTHKAVF